MKCSLGTECRKCSIGKQCDKYLELCIEEVELIDSTSPEELPLLVNRKWTSEEVHQRYKDRLAEAYALMDVLEKHRKNPDSPILFE